MRFSKMKTDRDSQGDERWLYVKELPLKLDTKGIKKNKWWCWCCDEPFKDRSHVDEEKHMDLTRDRTRFLQSI